MPLRKAGPDDRLVRTIQEAIEGKLYLHPSDQKGYVKLAKDIAEAIEGDYNLMLKPTPDACLAVEHSLLPETAQAALETAYRMWPRLAGAHLADVIDMVIDGDKLLEWREEVTAHPRIHEFAPPAYIQAAAVAVYLLIGNGEDLNPLNIQLVGLIAKRAAGLSESELEGRVANRTENDHAAALRQATDAGLP